jgi:glycosyltransferase involved in cell wall biosynthesis
MRVLQAVQELAVGGAERVVLALLRGAQEAGHEAAVAAAPGLLAADFDTPPLELPLVQRRLWRLPRAALALRRAVQTTAADIVHFHNPGIAAVGALATGRGRTVPGLVSVHGVPDQDYPAAARVLRLAGFPVVACGPGVATALEAAGARVRATIVNGVGPPPPPALRETLAEAWGISPQRPLILSVGRLAPQKNHVLAVEALAAVPDAVLVIVGEGPQAAAVEQAAIDHRVAERVVLAGLRPDARALIGAADVVVLPSRWEGLPLVALEALAAGTPLVATAVRGIRELLHHEVDALLVPPDEPQALADGLRRALADRELRAQLRGGGLRTATAYSETAMVAAYLDLYAQLLPIGSRDH